MTSPDLLSDVPEDRREQVRAALMAALEGAAVESLAPVAGGASGALTYRVEADGRAYLLRLETQRDFFRDPVRNYACMQTAAAAGVAPPVRYADPAAGVALMDFIVQRPLTEHPGGTAGIVRDLGHFIGTLQRTDAFPQLADYLDIVGGMLNMVRGSPLFAPGLLEPHAAGFERLRAAYPWDPAAHVSSHNDPNPRNIMYDGERLWLVDWETAFRNDRYADIAIVANEFATEPALEDALLTAWLGHAPDEIARARLTLMRQLTHLYYAGLILTQFAAVPRERPDDLSAPSLEAFLQAIRSGEIKPSASEGLYTMGKITLADYLQRLESPALLDALRVLEAK
ncbi:MAG: phosphotransferase [Pseudomonadales bacterium]